MVEVEKCGQEYHPTFVALAEFPSGTPIALESRSFREPTNVSGYIIESGLNNLHRQV